MASPFRGFSFIVILSVILGVNQSEGIAVMSIDFGSEWMKVAIVSVSKNYILNKKTYFYLIFMNFYVINFSLVCPWK